MNLMLKLILYIVFLIMLEIIGYQLSALIWFVASCTPENHTATRLLAAASAIGFALVTYWNAHIGRILLDSI